MSQTIDQKVLEMRFDNKQFESGISTSMSSLGKLKQSLNLKGASQGLENINSAANKCNLSVLSGAVETVQAKFSALQVMGVTALANITNSAVNAGKKIVSALTIDPIKTGFQEYETQINAVQTILANTSHNGTTLDQVNSALDTLNTYADKTIYNFTEMTKNIGTFTAAGVDLDTSVSSIQGIANLAAISGSTSQQASTAMYQLSQALAAGKVSLMDWNSVVNAGMGGKVFQDALVRTSELLGTGAQQAIDTYGSFRESLTQGEWLTTEVLTETLKQFSGAYTEADLIQQGFTESQAKEIMQMAQTAEDAATKVKTFTQLWDTLKESAQSGWTQSWEIIVGDFEEAKELLTEISDVIGGLIGESANARNELLQGWKDLGGRTALIDALRNAFEGVMSIIKPISEAFREIFPPITAQQLVAFSEGLRDLTAKLKISGETADKIKRVFKGIFSVLDIVRQAIVAVAKPFAEFLGGDGVSSFGEGILNAAASLGDFFTKLNEGIKAGEGFSFVSDTISGALNKISEVISLIFGKFSGFGDFLSSVGDVIVKVFGKIKDVITPVIDWIRENISAGDLFAGLAGGGLFLFLTKLSGFVGKLKDLSDGGLLGLIFGKNDKDSKGLLDSFKEVLGGVNETLQSFTQNIKVMSIVGIAVAITLLSSSLRKIAELSALDIVKGLVTIGAGLKIMVEIVDQLDTIENPKSAIAGAASILLLSFTLNKIANALKNIGSLGWEEIAKGLVGIGGALLAMTKVISNLDLCVSKGKTNIANAASILILSFTLNKIGNALKNIADLEWEEIAKGLVGIGGALFAMAKVVDYLDLCEGKTSIANAASILILSFTLSKIGNALKAVGDLEWEEIAKGLVGIGGALLAMAKVVDYLDLCEGKTSIANAASILILSFTLSKIGDAIKTVGDLSWEDIAQGLVGLGGALFAMAKVVDYLDLCEGKTSIANAASILILSFTLEKIGNALSKIGNMSWEEIARGLVGMGGALLEIGGITGALGKFAGISGVLGGAAIWITVQSLEQLANAFKKFGEMSWDEIGRGLVAMGAALLEVGVISGALGYLTGVAGILGGAAIWVSVQGLDQLANALKKFGEMSWEEIGRGLAAMGGALGEIALGSIASTLGIIGGFTIDKVSSSLGMLADAFIKFGSMDFESVKSATAAMAAALGETALGGLINTFSGFGAGAIATVAKPLGDLATSVKKWKDVTIPEGLNEKLAQLSLGVQSWTWAFMGGWSMSAAVEPLGALADAINKWKNVTVPEGMQDKLTELSKGVESWTWAFMGGWSMGASTGPIGDLADAVTKWKDVTVPEGMQDSLTELSKGVESWSWAFMGGWSMGASVGPLGDLADAISKWKDVSIPEGLGDSLKNLAPGIEAFNFAGWGADAIGAVAVPLGNLANSVKKWAEVTVPEGLGAQLSSLAPGIGAFNFSGWGADAIAAVASPLGNLADSVAKWIGLEVPDGIGTQLEGLGKGVSAFNFSGWGADAIAAVGEPLGALADSVGKWIGLEVPEGIGTQLADIATGVEAFNFSGWGGDAIAKAATPIGDLADSVKKWIDITVPEDLGSNLEDLGKGVGAFNFDGWGADSIAAVAEPLGTLADSVKKWVGITIPEDFATKLGSLADGVKKFNWAGDGSNSIATVAGPMGTLADSVKKWTEVTIPEGFGTQLGDVAGAIKPFTEIDGSLLSTLGHSFEEFAACFNSGYYKLSEVIAGFPGLIETMSSVFTDLSGISPDLTALRDAFTELASIAETAGSDAMTAFANAVSNSTGPSDAITSVISAMKEAITGSTGDFETAGSDLGGALATGVSNKSSDVETAGSDLAGSAASGASSNSSGMESAGYDLGNGLVAGINSKWQDAYNAGFSLGQAAVQGEKDGQASASPSKETIKAGKWLGEGLVIGINKMGNAVYKAGSNMGSSAVGSISNAIAAISDSIDADIDTQPTIRPVLDLSDIKSGASAMNGMLDLAPSVGVMSNLNSINSAMNRRIQNGANDDVVSAINKLRKDVGNLENKSYSVGDITYSSGDEVANAIETLVRAVRVEGRV